MATSHGHRIIASVRAVLKSQATSTELKRAEGQFAVITTKRRTLEALQKSESPARMP